jgi:hypothetical protein
MAEITNIKELYDSIPEDKKCMIQIGMFPIEIMADMDRLGIKAHELMKFDENVKAQKGIGTINTIKYGR